jgi:outer membrane protein TolC
VVLAARSAFYNVVQAIRLADVASGALRLAQDDERRVRALFEVGSVSKSDLLKAQVRTAQSQLDSLTAGHTVIRQRIALAKLVGVQETQLGEVDTVLTAAPREYDEAQILSEAARSRPDLRAAAAELAAARAGLLSSRLSRLPALVGSGSVNFATRSEFDQRAPDYDALSGAFLGIVEGNGKTETHRVWGANVALRWNIFDGLLADSRTASSRARLLRAEEGYAALRRNLEGEVRDAMQTYREAVERETVARRALESAQEDLKLSQEKYNVGSATILELIDAQVQLQRAQSDLVSALAAIRVAEAQVERVRGSAK